MIINWRTGNDPDALNEQIGLDAATEFNDPSLTQQHFAKDADLNTIIKRYGITDGAIPPAAADGRYYGDFSDAFDFRDVLDRTRDAIAKFNKLPAEIRAEFGNDPATLHDWIMNPDNAEEAVTMGLLAKTPTPNTPPPKTDAAVDTQKAL